VNAERPARPEIASGPTDRLELSGGLR